MIRRSIAIVLVVTTTWISMWAAAPGFAAASPETPIDYSESTERVDQFMKQVDHLRSLIDRTQFDPEALLESLDYDHTRIIGFVKKEVRFEPYSGLLRGANGTLMSRAGNALDQSVLLAHLLKEAGLDARIARSHLSRSAAKRLILEVFDPRPNPRTLANAEKIGNHIIEMAKAAGVQQLETQDLLNQILNPPKISHSPEFKGVANDTDAIIGHIADLPTRADQPRAIELLVDDTQDYFYVEFRTGPSSPWEVVHPVFADAPAGHEDLTNPQTYFASSIPSDLQHRLRLAVTATKRVGQRSETVELFSPWERPVANLVGVPLVYTNAPSALTDLSDIADIEEVLKRSTFLVPVLNDAPAPDASAFDLSGNLVPLDVAGTPAAEVFRTFGSKAGNAASAIAGLGADSPQPERSPLALQSVSIEYTLVKPGGSEETFQRYVLPPSWLDSRTTEDRTEESQHLMAMKSLTTSYMMMLSVGSYPQEFVLDQSLQQIQDSNRALTFLLEQASYGKGEFVPPPAEVMPRDLGLANLMLYSRFDYGASELATASTFRPEPSLVVIENGLSPSQDELALRMAVDIVNNTRRVLEQKNGEISFAVSEAIRLGVWETYAERVAPSDGAIETFNTTIAFSQARAHQIPSKLISASLKEETLTALSVPGDVKERLRNTIAAGYTVIVPEHLAPENPGMTGWWRIDPITGETLGQTSDGRGAELVEYLIVWAFGFLVAFSTCVLATFMIIRVSAFARRQMESIRATGNPNIPGHPLPTPKDIGLCAGVGIAAATLIAGPAATLTLVPGLVVHTIWTGGIGWGFATVVAMLNHHFMPSDW